MSESMDPKVLTLVRVLREERDVNLDGVESRGGCSLRSQLGPAATAGHHCPERFIHCTVCWFLGDGPAAAGICKENYGASGIGGGSYRCQSDHPEYVEDVRESS
ncbi:uncharacterized protein LOC124302620 [Neodiprion virginianus]|uniref:Uncharacterized protein LOC124294014 n=1 Tax=Neodiprion lecontei TaxID=441921 RepID=A0ABM3FZH6_NEOLC|nr:uncharacterized protein LOC124180135 [Neodiprion fabricii]XP_046477846.1 uncharacterized protein LOC124216844 [Neodiprion pinetum]XP_046593406.1 uncharacterized protein LOC124294014 [Neodiprion lecontei]XP_046614908.1 uncharacterized protein LOC124302620 [Neodiprion virginianus]